MMGPKEKKERALGEHLHLKGERCNSPKCALLRKPYRPGMHGKKRQRPISEYGTQLKEKQKFKISYGLKEHELLRVFKEASRTPGSTSMRILELLERRLDNVVFRLGLGISRPRARQLVRHGHITVNGRRVRSPGYLVRVGDKVAVREVSRPSGLFRTTKETLAKYEPPSWLRLHIQGDELGGEVLALPEDPAVPFNVNLLVESFSK